MLQPDFLPHFVESILYASLGVVVFGLSLWAMGKLGSLRFSQHK